eukprot:13576379-Alexandrium_andersonii.AAC.1
MTAQPVCAWRGRRSRPIETLEVPPCASDTGGLTPVILRLHGRPRPPAERRRPKNRARAQGLHQQ